MKWLRHNDPVVREKHNASSREWYKKNKANVNPARSDKQKKQWATNEKFRELKRKQGRDWYRDNPAKVQAARERKAAYFKQWREKNKDRKRDYDMKMRFNGFGLADYNRLLLAQGGKCAICGKDEAQSTRTGHLFVDHNHTTGAIRGLLCHFCNVGLGLLGDNIETLRAAADYLSNPAVHGLSAPR